MDILGNKIHQARIMRGMSITDLADNLGVSKQSIFQYENKISKPSKEIIFKLSSILKFPISFFTTPYEFNLERTNTFFRAQLSASQIEKMSLAQRAIIVAYFYNFLQKYLELPTQNILEINEESLDRKNYDDIAMKVRTYWGLNDKPILNMVNILEENGIVITTIKVPDKKIDAFTQTHDKEVPYCVMLEDTKHSMARRNFTLAHELGHMILHSNLSFNELEKERRVELEKEADCFAAAFLIPKNTFIQDIQDPTNLDSYIKLKRKWHVSIFAMIMRAKALELINEKNYISLIKKYSYRGYRTNEPLDNEISIKKPVLFEQSLSLLFDNNIITMDSLLNEMAKCGLALNVDDICSFFALNSDFFEPYANKKMNISIKSVNFENS